MLLVGCTYSEIFYNIQEQSDRSSNKTFPSHELSLQDLVSSQYKDLKSGKIYSIY